MADAQTTVPAGGQQQAPSSADDSQNLLNLYKQIIGAGSQTPGANVPYIRDPYQNARMPSQPPLIPQQDTDVQAQGQSLYDKKMAHQQSIGRMLGNAVSGVVNAKMQKDYRNNVGIIKDYSDARIKWDEATRVANYYKSQGQPVPPDVQKVLSDNQGVMQNIEGDNKKWRVVQKSFPDYTDPTKNQTPQVMAGQAGRQQAIQANTQGFNNNNPQEAKVSSMSDKLQGIPPPTQQPTRGTMGGGGPTPQGLPPYQGPAINVQGQAGQPSLVRRPPPGQGVGPVAASSGVTTKGGTPTPATPVQPAGAGAAQWQPAGAGSVPFKGGVQNATPEAAKEAGKTQAVAQAQSGDWQPRMNFPSELKENPAFAAQQAYEQKMGELFVQHIIPRALQEEGATQRKILGDQMELVKEQMRINGELAKEGMHDKNVLDREAVINGRTLATNELKYGGIGLTSKDPRYAGMAPMAYLKGADLIDKQMKTKIADNTSLQTQINQDQNKIRGFTDPLGNVIPAADEATAKTLQADIATKTRQMQMNTDTISRLQNQYNNFLNMADKASSAATAAPASERSVVGPGGSIQSPADVPQGIKDFASAIALGGEGFGQEGTAPTRANNPGALKQGNVGGRGVTGLAGITKYGSEGEGWLALYNKLYDISQGRSRVYSPNMTINQFARAYVGNAYGDPIRDSQEQVNWANRVAGKLGVSTDTKIGDIIGRQAPKQQAATKSVAGIKSKSGQVLGPHEDDDGGIDLSTE